MQFVTAPCQTLKNGSSPALYSANMPHMIPVCQYMSFRPPYHESNGMTNLTSHTEFGFTFMMERFCRSSSVVIQFEYIMSCYFRFPNVCGFLDVTNATCSRAGFRNNERLRQSEIAILF